MSAVRPMEADANSPLTYLLLAFAAMAGLAYINFMPGLVNALAGMGFSDAEAGRIVAANGYGGIVGSTTAVFIVRRVNWLRVMLIALTTLAAIDMASSWVEHYRAMIGWRFSAGIVGGLSVGIAFSVLARLQKPERAFGLLLFMQFSVGSLVLFALPTLEAQADEQAVFFVMAGLSAVSIACLLQGSSDRTVPDLSQNPSPAKQANVPSGVSAATITLMIIILTYQIAASGIWAYVGLIGLSAGISSKTVSYYIASTGILGLAGALLPVFSGKRPGHRFWLVCGTGVSVMAAGLLTFSHYTTAYIMAMALLFFSWPAVLAYLLAETAAIDESGQLSTIANVVSSVGLASGPLIASMLLAGDSYTLMLYCSSGCFLLAVLLLLIPWRTAPIIILGRRKSAFNSMKTQSTSHDAADKDDIDAKHSQTTSG